MRTIEKNLVALSGIHMKIVRSLLSLFFFLSLLVSSAQSIQFKQSIGGPYPDYGYCARQTYDNGYIAVGSASSSTTGNADMFVVKTDSNGIVIWRKQFGSPNIEIARWVEETSDSSLIIVGYTNNTGGKGYDIDLLKLDRWGEKIWEKMIGGPDWEFAYSVHPTTDGGYIIAGGTYSYGKGNEDAYLVKTDGNGDTLWTKTYGGGEDDEARSVKQTSDGGFILTGSTKSFADAIGDVYLIKTNASGDTVWTKTYGGAKADIANDVIECMDGNFALCGATESYHTKGPDFYLLKIQQIDGAPIWTSWDGRDTAYDALQSIVELKNGYLASIGIRYGAGGGGTDGYLFITDALGNWQDGPTYGTGGNDECYSVAKTRDNGFIICGNTDSTNFGYASPNLFLVKVDSTGHLNNKLKFYLSSKINSAVISSLEAFPNPFSENTRLLIHSTVEIRSTELSLKATDISGRSCAIDYNVLSSQTNRIELELHKNNLTPGIYFLRYYFRNQPVGVSKIVVE